MKIFLTLCFLAAGVTLIIFHHPVWGGLFGWMAFGIAASKATEPKLP